MENTLIPKAKAKQLMFDFVMNLKKNSYDRMLKKNHKFFFLERFFFLMFKERDYLFVNLKMY